MQGKFEILLLLAALYVASAKVIDEIEVPECPENETWNLCGDICRPTCDDPHPDTRWCPKLECTVYTSGCRCISGFLRDSEGSGKCIPKEDCSKPLV